MTLPLTEHQTTLLAKNLMPPSTMHGAAISHDIQEVGTGNDFELHLATEDLEVSLYNIKTHYHIQSL